LVEKCVGGAFGERPGRAGEAMGLADATEEKSQPRGKRFTFVVTFRTERYVVDGPYMLRQLLKIALRRYGLRCIDIRSTETHDVV
jgi:hypothetical protein